MLTFRQCMEEMLEVIGRKRLLVPIPWWVARLQGSILGMLPNPPLTTDQVTLLEEDNVVSADAEKTGAHAGRPRHPAAVDGSDPALLSLAVPDGRPVHAQDRGVILSARVRRLLTRLDGLASFLPDGIGAGAALLLVVASFFTSALTAAFGVGGGVAMLALMGLFVPVAALIPVHGSVQLGSNTGRAWHQRANVRLDITVPFVVGSVIGAIAGAFLVVQLPDALLKLVLAVFIIAITWAKIPGIDRLGKAGLAVASTGAGAAVDVRRRHRAADVGHPGADPQPTTARRWWPPMPPP